ncbi:MAG: AzlD domain-containing protein [Clostridia bacterium]|nr:AzlD domain-containing protein [Clostridia bacterium]
MNYTHSIAIVAVVALVTALLRFLPFIILNGKRKTPEIIVYMGKVLSFAIMGMLVVYCLKGISFSAPGSFLPELIAGAVVTLLHVAFKNTLISVVAGTLTYMFLIQFIF